MTGSGMLREGFAAITNASSRSRQIGNEARDTRASQTKDKGITRAAVRFVIKQRSAGAQNPEPG
jgi:hypothetical protein